MVQKFNVCTQGQCPQCLNENLDYQNLIVQDNMVCYPFVCNECDYEGKEWYNLTYIESE